MRSRGPVAVLITLSVATAGALLAEALHVPVAALLGSSAAVAVLAAVRGIGALPVWLRNAGFTAIGVSLGGGIDTSLAGQLPGWSLSLAMLGASLVATLWLGALVLQRVAGFDRETAVLAMAPGTMSNVIALAVEGRGDVGAIMALQVARLLFLVLIVPPFAALMDAGGIGTADQPAPMALLPLVVLLITGHAAGMIGDRLRIPAACFLFGLIFSAVAHAGGLIEGGAPGWTLFVGLAIAGAAMGIRLNGIAGASWRRLLLAAAAMLVVALAVSIGFAILTALLADLPMAQVWIAFAPGGVEAMAAIGLALGYDPGFVALHHFARILMLVVLMPLAVGRMRPGSGQPSA